VARGPVEALDRFAQAGRGQSEGRGRLLDEAGHGSPHPGDLRAHRRAPGQGQLAYREVDRLDAVGALVDREDAGVAEMLRGARLLDEAHAAVDLHPERGDLDADVGRKGLGH
jgi:hypothetical protein